MATVKDKQNLDEIIRICRESDGYGIIIEIYSNDHGKLGSKRFPAHAHLFDTGRNEIGEFVLTYDAPKSPSDVVWYRTDNPPEGYASKIVKWSRGFSKYKINNWARILQAWDDFHYK